MTSNFGARRDLLVAKLGQVSELEHATCCLYLFAAASMKLRPSEGSCTWAQIEQARVWKTTLLSIARQEMEHLAIVSNLLTAIGEAPWYRRPAFPVGDDEYPNHLELPLTAFSLEAVGRFLLIELPESRDDDERRLRDGLSTSTLPEDHELLRRLDQASDPNHVLDTLAALYQEIVDLFDELGNPAKGGDPKALFVGPPEAQVGNAAVFPTFPPVPDNVRNYDVLVSMVTDLDSAQQAIRQIRLEGEGGPSADVPSGGDHFGRFVEMYLQLSEATRLDPAFTPGRPVVDNPVTPPTSRTRATPAKSGTTTVTRQDTAEAMEIYAIAYDVALRMLIHLFAYTPEAHDEYEALQDTVFFPMMTLVFRPLGDILTEMPAFDDGRPGNAGPSFVTARDIGLLPHPGAAWKVMTEQLRELRDRMADLAHSAEFDPGIMERLSFMAENTWRMHSNFAAKTGLGVES